MLMQSMHASQDALWVAELAAAVVADSQPGNLTQKLEESLRRALPVRTVELAKVSEGTPIVPARVDATHVGLRVASAHGPYVLRVSFRPGYAADHTALSRLHLAASLASLVLEIERGRRMSARSLAANTEAGHHRPLVGASEPMNELSRLIERVAKNDFIVLVEGESGSGKELVARRIHELSRRRHGPFVAVNCAALVETLFEAELFGIEDRTATGVRGRRGKFELADTGTLFLDEVSDLSSVAQAKLLRAIQELTVERVGSHDPRRVDVRIVVPPTAVWGRWSPPAVFGPTCSTGSTASRSWCRPCARARAMCRDWRRTSSPAIARRALTGSRSRRSMRWGRITGPATCGSSSACWSVEALMLYTVIMLTAKLLTGLLLAGLLVAISMSWAPGRLPEWGVWAIGGACLVLVFAAAQWRRAP